MTLQTSGCFDHVPRPRPGRRRTEAGDAHPEVLHRKIAHSIECRCTLLAVTEFSCTDDYQVVDRNILGSPSCPVPSAGARSPGSTDRHSSSSAACTGASTALGPMFATNSATRLAKSLLRAAPKSPGVQGRSGFRQGSFPTADPKRPDIAVSATFKSMTISRPAAFWARRKSACPTAYAASKTRRLKPSRSAACNASSLWWPVCPTRRKPASGGARWMKDVDVRSGHRTRALVSFSQDSLCERDLQGNRVTLLQRPLASNPASACRSPEGCEWPQCGH